MARAGLLIAGLALVGPMVAGGLVQAHDAMSGWTYPTECCSGHDCYEIAQTDLEPVADGWMIKETSEVILFDKAKVSGDGRFHRCSYGGDRKAGTICLYVPAGG